MSRLEEISRPRLTITDNALLAAWAAVPLAERHAFTCEALGDDAAAQLLRALADRQPDEPAPLPAADELRAMWARESAENVSARNNRPRKPAPAERTEEQRAAGRAAARRHRERQCQREREQAAPAAD
jgi:hypothetical protein